MKAVIAALLLSAAGLAQAEEQKEVPRPQQMEEIVVVGYDWSFDEHKGALMMGLNGAYLIHEYDKKRNEWRFIRASNVKLKDE